MDATGVYIVRSGWTNSGFDGRQEALMDFLRRVGCTTEEGADEMSRSVPLLWHPVYIPSCAMPFSLGR